MKTLPLTIIATLALTSPLAGLAQKARQLQPNEHPTNLPGVTTIEAPPAGFDPIAASDEDLAYHGFPPRPNETTAPKAYGRWVKAIQASKTRVVPQLEQTTISHRPQQINTKAGAPPTKDNAAYNSYIWSGYFDYTGTSTYSSASYYYAYADFEVPVAQQAFGVCNGMWDYGDAFVGLDGVYTADVLQAGAEFDAYCSGSTKSTFYTLWYEWYPNPEVRISSVPVAPGDELFVEVWHTTTTQGYAYIVNETTNQSVEFGFTAPAGYQLVGNTAEWIVEGAPPSGAVTRLTNYTAVPFWDAYAVTESSVTTDPSSPSSNTFTMIDAASKPISYATLLGPAAFVMQDEGSAKF